MDTFAALSPTTFAAPKPYDPDADRTLIERLSTPLRGADIASAYDAAERSRLLVDSHRSADIARADWFSRAADRVKAASGVDLPNPYYAPVSPSSEPTGLMNASADPMGGRSRGDLERSFFQRVGELVAAHPELADIDPALVEAGARGNAIEADRALGRLAADPNVNPIGRFLGETAGVLVGGVRAADPAALASFGLPVGGAGASVLARIADAAVVQGVGGAAIAAAEQPGVQARRAELGLDAGLGPGVANVAAGALGGALGGAVFQGAGEALGGLASRLFGGRVRPEDVAPLVAEARARGAFVAEDDAAALVRAAHHDAATADMLAARPDTVPEHAAARQLADGLRAVEDPSAPLPLMDRPVAPGTTDDVARALVDTAADPLDAVARLRASEEATASALVSDDPALRDLGRLATLDRSVDARIASGEIDPVHASIVAATTPDPSLQGAALAAIGEAKPRSPAEARLVAADAVAANSPLPTPLDGRGRKPRPERPVSLIEFLAGGPGLAPDPDLAALFGGANPFLPGRGRLIRRSGGMSLDHAREAALEAGYLVDAGFLDGSPSTSTIRDLLDAIDAEVRGSKRYPWGEHVAPVQEDPVPAADLRRLVKSVSSAVRFADGFEADPFILETAARLLWEGRHTDPIAAFDDAALAFERSLMRESEQFPDIQRGRIDDVGEIPGWDFPSEPGGSPQAGEPVGPRREAAGRGRVENARPGGEASPYGGRDRGAPAPGLNQSEIRDAVPFVRDDGTISLVRRAEIARVAERERWMGDVVAACKA